MSWGFDCCGAQVLPQLFINGTHVAGGRATWTIYWLVFLLFDYVVNLSGKPFPIELDCWLYLECCLFYFEHNVCQFPIYPATVSQYIANISPIIPRKSGWWFEAHVVILHPTWDDDPQIHRCFRHRMCTGIERSSNSKWSQLQPTNKGWDCLYIIMFLFWYLAISNYFTIVHGYYCEKSSIMALNPGLKLWLILKMGDVYWEKYLPWVLHCTRQNPRQRAI